MPEPSSPKYVQASDIPATFEDLGLDRRRVAEWREVRDAGAEVVERAIEVALSEQIVEHLELSGFEIDEDEQTMRRRPPTPWHG
jgi:hypothetical protein